MRWYGKDDVLRKVPGLSYRQLDHWTAKDYLRSPQAGQGSGSARHWSGHEVDVAALMLRLTKHAGMSAADAAYTARAVVEGDLDSIALGTGLRLHVERPRDGYVMHREAARAGG